MTICRHGDKVENMRLAQEKRERRKARNRRNNVHNLKDKNTVIDLGDAKAVYPKGDLEPILEGMKEANLVVSKPMCHGTVE